MVDTVYVRTYTVFMNITFSVDEKTVARARKRAEAMGRSLNQVIREYLQKLAGSDDPERSIEEFRRLSGTGDSRGWRFNRDEIHERS
jgi:Ribbon-helix-helix protein, copG family